MDFKDSIKQISERVIKLKADMSNENNWYSVCTGIILTIMSAYLANKILK